MNAHDKLTEPALSVSNSPRACVDRIGSDQDLKQQASLQKDVHAALKELSDRGITSPEQFASLGAPAIIGCCRWFDAQNGRVGTGVLVAELRAGGKPGWKPRRAALDEQAEYGESIVQWLRQNFPQWNRDEGNRTHSAAIAAVVRLHHQHGKGNLTKAKHGGEIRAAVDAWEDKWGGANTKEHTCR